MNHFPHNPFKRSATSMAGPFGSVRQAIISDVLWGKPLFKAPALPNPRVLLDPLPLKVAPLAQRLQAV